MNARTVHLGVRVTPALDAAFRSAARVRGTTPSGAMRDALAAYVEATASESDERPVGPGAAESDPAVRGRAGASAV